MRFTYEVDQADIRYLEEKLKGTEKNAKGSLMNAINRAATQARKRMVEGAQEAYTVQKPSDISSRVKTQRANRGNLSAYVRARSRPFPIPKFRHRVSKGGVRTEIIRGRGLSDFIGPKGRRAWKSKNKEIVLQREGKERTPYKLLFSVSVPQMIEKVYKGERGTQGNLEPVIRRTLHDEIAAEIAKLI